MDDETSRDSSSRSRRARLINSCLPFRLQEFCLIAIINELDSYPVESLAMLPRHLRYLLLSNFPNYYLKKLDSTAVAEGIDTEKIWRHTTRRFGHERVDHSSMHACLFTTRETCIDLSHIRKLDDVPHFQPEVVAATKEKQWKDDYFLKMVLNILSDVGSLTDEYIARFGLEYYPDESVYAETIDGLTAVASHNFLVHLPDTVEGHGKLSDYDSDQNCESSDNSDDCASYNSLVFDSYRRLWNKQATPLAKIEEDYDAYLVLVPRRLMFIRQSSNQLELLNHIVIKCGCQPQNLHINVSDLHQADCNFRSQCSANEDYHYRSYLKSLLSKIVILSLEGVAADHADVLRFMFEMISENGTLKALEINSDKESMAPINLEFLSPYLFTMPIDPSSPAQYRGLNIIEFGFPLDLTCLSHVAALIEQQHTLTHICICLLDSCQPQSDNPGQVSLDERRLYDVLSLLFIRESFQCLQIDFACRQVEHNSVYVLRQGCHNFFPFAQTLQSFMISHCAYNQKLQFKNIRCLPTKHQLFLSPKAYESGVMIPDCATKHKLLLYDFADIYSILPHLIILPTIRLQEFAFSFEDENQPLFSQIAQHPNMNVTKLLINFDFPRMKPGEVEKLLSTLCQDFKKLFQMSALKEICICGQWLCFSEVKKAIVLGLQQRAQLQIGSLDKVHLRQESQYIRVWDDFPKDCYNYTDSEFGELWSAVFSLPHLDCMEVELWMEQGITMCFIERINIVKDCWKQYSFNKKLKSLLLYFHDWDDQFEEVWGEDHLEPLKILTSDINIFVDSTRVPKMYSYTHFTVHNAF